MCLCWLAFFTLYSLINNISIKHLVFIKWSRWCSLIKWTSKRTTEHFSWSYIIWRRSSHQGLVSHLMFTFAHTHEHKSNTLFYEFKGLMLSFFAHMSSLTNKSPAWSKRPVVSDMTPCLLSPRSIIRQLKASQISQPTATRVRVSTTRFLCTVVFVSQSVWNHSDWPRSPTGWCTCRRIPTSQPRIFNSFCTTAYQKCIYLFCFILFFLNFS